jgi:phosphatidylserine/phosphatidylglycerophosphate/cardiolipin synthase-like enzyme
MANSGDDGTQTLADLLRILNTGTLRTVLKNLQGGRSPSSIGFAADQLASGNLGEIAAIDALLKRGDAPLLVGIIEGALAQRELQQRRPQIAYSGMEPPVKETVRTRDVFLRMFSNAQNEITATAYSFSDPELHRALTDAAMRGVNVTLYMDVPQDKNDRRPAAMSQAEIERIMRDGVPDSHYVGLGKLWPTMCPNLRLRFDRRLLLGDQFASIHAKCVVVDARWCFITSANLTARGQERNVEVGVLLDDTELAERLLRLFGSLMAKGDFVEIAP